MTNKDLIDLKYAKQLLENPGFAAKISDLIGKPVEKGLEILPSRLSNIIDKAVSNSLNRALELSIKTINFEDKTVNKAGHKFAVFLSGGIGGAFGLTSLLVELPISTGIMLRSIAKIALSNGEDMNDINTRLSCLEVFAYGSNSKSDDASETGYYMTRAALAKSIADAARYITEKGLSEKSSPAIMRFLLNISSRFGIVVSQKAVATAVPVIGGLSGATVNLIFIDHFQKIAEGHFIVKRLEKKYGEDIVRSEYNSI
ncbi:MAG: EcsC family protein [Ignavibacteriaceae bacterium]|nr:MAG: EcsC family protein [Chlorobiota bacterium]MBV6399483.1 hypothetical protein [Ignavibacteria bacterium]MCC6886673.1 EcsC family protein [Ignavibacteriales bacterium]MCE7953189.1 EcsC family protein [Chlorobi bacterium CHB7]MEB2329029.1 EcsC family protein [Ignavibacteriaceae bacterium]RIK50060.1 MAG: peptidase [Ignavibacteriota bacterium]